EEMIQEEHLLPLNPSSAHSFGQKGKALLSASRQKIAHFLKVKPSEILFTSGGTESMNLLIRGSIKDTSSSILTSNLEHPAVFETIKELEKKGASITWLSPGIWGTPTPEMIRSALRPTTQLIILSAVNSETGAKLDLEKVAAVALEANIPLIIDGAQLLGKERFSIPPGVVGMGFSGHKIHAPKGSGFIFLRTGYPLIPLFTGGLQEKGMRSGTENLPAIMGLAKAIEILEKEIDSASLHMKKLRDLFEELLHKNMPGCKVNGEGPRISNTSNLFFEGIDGESLLIHLDLKGIAASQGSACSSGALEPSRILLNMGYSIERALSSLRFSFSRSNTEEEVREAMREILTHLTQCSCLFARIV
ncbi:MAG: cysteine desulfurase, partial [Simkania negevensis]|nr:cysteine desulfurase [Simkania negevensis]